MKSTTAPIKTRRERSVNDEKQDSTESSIVRRDRWAKRSRSIACPASVRLDRAARILLRVLANHHSHRNFILAKHTIDLSQIWQAAAELFGDRPVGKGGWKHLVNGPRGLAFGREAVEVARLQRAYVDTPGGEYPLLTPEEIKAAYYMARAMSTDAKFLEETRARRQKTRVDVATFFDGLREVLR